jgi:sarcosine oxidase
MYSNTPDQHFVVAQHPEHSNVTVACGFSGHGFKFVPVVGEVVADLATTGSTAHPIGLFDPRRPALHAVPAQSLVPSSAATLGVNA